MFVSGIEGGEEEEGVLWLYGNDDQIECGELLLCTCS